MSSSSDGSKKPKAGRVRHDARGRAIWDWATETGKHALESTSRLLKRLEMPGLSLADDQKDKKKTDKDAGMFGGPKENDPLKGGRQSFNPYDSRLPPKIQAPPPSSKPAARPPIRPSPAPKAESKPGLLGRIFGSKD
jgi:hypothetical protein